MYANIKEKLEKKLLIYTIKIQTRNALPYETNDASSLLLPYS